MSITKTREVFSLPNVHYALKEYVLEKGLRKNWTKNKQVQASKLTSPSLITSL